MQVWIYNVTNPGDFLNGVSGAELYEFGPYSYDLEIQRENVDFFNGGSEVQFTVVNGITYNQGLSCVGCGDIFADKVTVINPVYQAMIAGANSEFMMMLATTCSQGQIVNMLMNPSAPYCEKSDLNPNVNANCRCCVPAANTENITALDPDGSLAYCADVASPTGAKGSVISWLGSYDGGYKLSGARGPTSFPLSTGVYSPLLRTYTINEMISGSVSSLAGLFNYAAFSQSTAPADVAAIQALLTTTQDVKDVCYSQAYTFCPQLGDVMADIFALPSQPEKVQYMQNIKCTGYIPNYVDLMANGFTEERAMSLRYLEGVSCAQFAVPIAFAALIKTNPSNEYACADGVLPCCMKNFTLVGAGGSTTGSGMGCLRYVDGLLQKRRVFSADEAEEYLGSTVIHNTNCASSNRLHITEWMGQSKLTEWFTPSGYTYPYMPWADPSIVKGAGTQYPGTFSAFNLSDGRVVTQVLGTGTGKSFLRKNLNSGDVEEEEFPVYLPGINRVRTAKFHKNKKFDGLRVSKYYLKHDSLDASAESQMKGLLPYPNMVNLLYTSSGLPVILALPNFMGVDSDIYSQTSNAKRGYPDGVGVSMYRTHESYSRDSAEMTPELTTAASIAYYKEDFANWWEWEPATGLTITNQAASMFNMFTMNCNPSLDPTCAFARQEASTMCYPGMLSDGTTVTSPCSNANVFTPLVQGEKVLPMYWNRVAAAPPDNAIASVVDLLDVRYAFSILCILIPSLFIALMCYTLYLKKKQPQDKESNGGSRDSIIDMTARKSTAAPNDDRSDRGDVSLAEVGSNPIRG
jgi:hypothetical protein